MPGLTDTFANDLLATLFRGTATTAPATYYLALSTTEPAHDGSNVTEPSGGSYARVAVAKNTTNFAAPTARSISNAVAITFPTPTGDWGVVGWFVLYSASTAGTVLASGRFAEAVHVTTGMSGPVVPAGTLVINAPTP